jgi:archaellum component FlaC
MLFILMNKKSFLYQNFCINYIVKPHAFSTKTLKSDMGLSEIITEISTLLPQFSKFIDQFNTTVSQSGISVVTDTIGNMSIDVPQSMPEDVANKISTKIGVIDRLITTRGQNISDLLQKGTDLENKLKMADSNYVSQLTDKIQEFKRLNSSYKH